MTSKWIIKIEIIAFSLLLSEVALELFSLSARRMTSLVPCTSSEASQMHTRGHEVTAFLFASLVRSNLPPLRHLRIKRTPTNVKQRSAGGHRQKSTAWGARKERDSGGHFQRHQSIPAGGPRQNKSRTLVATTPATSPHHLRGKHTIISCSGFAPTPTNGTSPYANDTGIT